MGGILVFWDEWQRPLVKYEEIKLRRILDLNAKVKTDESKYWPRCEDEVLKCDKWEVRLSRQGPTEYCCNHSGRGVDLHLQMEIYVIADLF